MRGRVEKKKKSRWEPSSPKRRDVVGTDGYIAPEAYLGYVCPKNDIFSAGVVMFTLIAARFPFDDAIFDDWLEVLQDDLSANSVGTDAVVMGGDYLL